MKNIQHSTFNIQRSPAIHFHRHWRLNVECWVLEVPKFVLLSVIRLYRWTVSPALPLLFGPTGGCRFTPTCSQYAMDAIRSRGAWAGSWLALKRICRCHPLGDCGHDPAPDKKPGVRNSEFGI